MSSLQLHHAYGSSVSSSSTACGSHGCLLDMEKTSSLRSHLSEAGKENSTNGPAHGSRRCSVQWSALCRSHPSAATSGSQAARHDRPLWTANSAVMLPLLRAYTSLLPRKTARIDGECNFKAVFFFLYILVKSHHVLSLSSPCFIQKSVLYQKTRLLEPAPNPFKDGWCSTCPYTVPARLCPQDYSNTLFTGTLSGYR